MRKISALIVVAGLLASLTACSTASAPGSAGCTTPASGNASSVVTATGKFGSAPKVKLPSPIVTSHTEVSTLIQGHGQILTDGTPALIKLALYSGTTGKLLQSSYKTPSAPLTVGSTSTTTAKALTDALRCSTVGSRLAIAIRESDASATTGDTGDKSEPAYVAVVDVVKAFLPKANGSLRFGVNNMPAVVTAANGAPGISLPNVDAPKTEKVQVVREGAGRKITAKDTVVLQFTQIDWAPSPTVVQSTWTKGGAAEAVEISKVSDPVKKALVGQTVGSQVMAVIPGTDQTTGAPTTYVFVFDLLGTL
ncbi:FKBP-type peptidyl-prolyl cis-trans isomerase [Frondihabitans cladoniiphilus]|uniref:FKBP-type peptidyl-prolyl cis-trans isomerase n=1 Tax=Frondihabitans cladoniiphilus TaxID=715785 RepID=A0ABP8W7P0_9MICO